MKGKIIISREEKKINILDLKKMIIKLFEGVGCQLGEPSQPHFESTHPHTTKILILHFQSN